MNISIPYTALQAISLFAAKDDTRYYLNGVLLETTATETRLVATNGHVLGLWRQKEKHAEPGSLILPNDAVSSVLKFARTKREKEIGLISINSTGEKVSLELFGSNITTDPIDGKFPDYRRLFRDPGKPSGEPAQFDPEYLMLFAKADAIFGNISPKSSAISLHYNGGDSTLVECKHSGGSFVGIIMPKRASLSDPATLIAGIDE